MRTIKIWVQLVFLWATGVFFVHSQENSIQQSSYIRPAVLQKLLREPGGLEAAAKLAGHFEMREDGEVWGTPTLESLISGSSLIIEGTIAKEDSRLVSDGDKIISNYSVNISQTLKGSDHESSSVTFSAPGGMIKFPNGTSACVRTVESDNLHEGERYIFFLTREDSQYGLYSSSAGALKISPKDETLSTLDANDLRSQPLASSLLNMRSNNLADLIHNWTAQKR